MSESSSQQPGPQDRERLDLGEEFPQGIVAAPLDSGVGPATRPGYGYGSNVLGDADVHLLDYVRVLYKRRWTATTAFLALFLTVTIYTFTTTPIYEARTQILIEKENSNVVTFKQAIEQNQVADDYYQTQYKILQSRGLARRTVETLKLWNHPRFRKSGAAVSTATGTASAPLSWPGSWFGASKDVARADAEETREQSAVLDRFLNDLTVSPIRNSRLVDVKFASPDAALAASIANTIAKGYIEQSLESKFLSSKEASDWLGERLGEQRKLVESSELALQRYREQTDSVALEDRQNIVVQKLADLNAAVTRAKTERIQKEAAYNQIKGPHADGETFPALLSNVFIQQQKGEIADLQRQQAQASEKLGPRHPDMLKITNAIAQAEIKLRAETAKVVQSVKSEYEAALSQERTLMTALDAQKRDALELNRKGIDYGALQRDAAANRQVFESLMQRTKETGIAGELRTSNIRVVDPAEVPRRPASPNAIVNLLLALLGGSALALGLVFFFEYLDNRIKTPDEIKAHLGVPFLGMVPALFEHPNEDPLMSNGVPANFSESFRAIRTNLLFSSADNGCKTIVITSSGPGEGKTLVASNLAVALAQASQRVLLIDADMRKPRVHGVFKQRQEPGLSNVLVGNAKASESVRPTGVPGLWILPAGVIPPNPAELIGSKRFREFVASLALHFDHVIVDTPPVMAVTDAAIAAHAAQGVVFVVGAEMTSRHTARRSVEQLDQAKAVFVGAILNRVDLKHHGYYYSQYYRKEYGEYYAAVNATGTLR